MAEQVRYTEEDIKSLDWREHIRLRPGMYIGKTGDGSAPDDGIYLLLKEIIDNSIDEHVMGYGKEIDIQVNADEAVIRDFGRGIPLGKVIDCVSKINTGGKYDSKAFKKSVGLNGVGTKAVNALSDYFKIESIRNGKVKKAEFEQGNLKQDYSLQSTDQSNGTIIQFRPDHSIFKNYHFIPEHLENQIWNYVYLNSGLKIRYNGKVFHSKNGLLDLVEKKNDPETFRYPVIHFKGEDIEFALTHDSDYGEKYYSFVNGQFTVQGGTHLSTARDAIVKTLRDFYNKNFEAVDIRASIVAAISIRMQDPVFESQTKTKLGSTHIDDDISMRAFIGDFIKKELDDYLHKYPKTADTLLHRILQSERERKDMAGIKKLANQRAKKANLHNKKLRDCRVHLTDDKHVKHLETSIFITEGDSASGSITKARDVETQAVFSLRGKPLNTFGLSKKVVYENEEFNLLQHALNIEETIEDLRYNRVILATDADVDGMHIRMLLLTFFLQFFPELAKNGHLYILETPLFRVRDKRKTIYCYNATEKVNAMTELNNKAEVTRFKGLGEISPGEFEKFILEDMRLSPVIISDKAPLKKILEYYMGKNTLDRQNFIINNLRVEKEVQTEEV